MSRRFLALTVMLVLVATSCSMDAVEVAESGDPDPVVESSTAAETTAEPVELVLPTGREAIAAANEAGQPYILWFWGAH